MLPQYTLLRRLFACSAMFLFVSFSLVSWDSQSVASNRILVSVLGFIEKSEEGRGRKIICVMVEGIVSLDVVNVEEIR